MADYEVNVTPVINIDFDKLKEDVRGLSGVIESAAKGKIKVEVDTGDINEQIGRIKAKPVKVTTALDDNSFNALESEIMKRVERVAKLNAKSMNLNAASSDSRKAHKEEITWLVEGEAHLRKLIDLRKLYDAAGGEQRKMDLSPAGLDVWKDLLGYMDEFKATASGVMESFKNKFEKPLEKPTVDIAVGFNDFDMATQTKQLVGEGQEAANVNPIELNVDMEQARRDVNIFLSQMQNKIAELNGVVIPLATGRDNQSPGRNEFRKLYGANGENYNEERYSVDMNSRYRQRVSIIAELVAIYQQLVMVADEDALKTAEKIVSLDKLGRMIATASTQINHHTEILERLRQAKATDEDVADRDVALRLAINDEDAVRDLNQALDIAQHSADKKPVVLKSEFAEEQLDAIIKNVIDQGKEAQEKLNALGAYKHTRSEINKEAVTMGEDPVALVEKYKQEGAFSERLTKQLKAERVEREELQRIIRDSRMVLSADSIEFTGWDMLRNADERVDGKAFNLYLRSIREMKQEAEYAEKELGKLASGLKEYSVTVERTIVAKPAGVDSFTGKGYAAEMKTEVEEIRRYGRDLEDALREYYGPAFKGLSEETDIKVVDSREIEVSQDKINSLINTIEQYNQVLQSTDAGVAELFGKVQIPVFEIPLAVATDIDLQQAVTEIIKDAQRAADINPIELTFKEIDLKVQELSDLQHKLAEVKTEINNAISADDVRRQASYDDGAFEKLRQSYEAQGMFVYGGAEQFNTFMAEKGKTLTEYSNAIENVRNTILELGASSGDVPASIDFISRAMDKANKSAIDFSDQQKRATEDVAEGLKAVIAQYREFVIPDKFAGKGTKAYGEYKGLKDSNMGFKYKDENYDETTLGNFERQRSMLLDIKVLAEEYQQSLDGGKSHLGKPVLKFLDDLQGKIQSNNDEIDRLHKKLGIDEPVAASMNKFIGEQILETRGTQNPFEGYSDEWFEAEKAKVIKLIGLYEQYNVTLGKLNSAGMLKSDESTSIAELQRDLAWFESEHSAVITSRTVKVEAKLEFDSTSPDEIDIPVIEAEMKIHTTGDEFNKALEVETKATGDLNVALEKHSDVMDSANAAERSKIATSQELGSVLASETRNLEAYTDALDRVDSKPVIDADLSGLKFDTKDIDGLQGQLQRIFDEALSRQDEFVSAKVNLTVAGDDHELQRAVVTFKDKVGSTMQQMYGLVNVSKDAAADAADKVEDMLSGIAGKAEKEFKYLETKFNVSYGQDSRFNADHERVLADQQIKTLEARAKGLNLVFDDLRRAAANITDPSSLAEYNHQWDIAKEKISTAKAELQSIKQLDTVAAMQRRIDNFDADIRNLRADESDLKLTGFQDINANAEDFDKLSRTIQEAESKLIDFIKTQDSLTTEGKVAAFDELIKQIKDAENQYDTLNRKQSSHRKELADYLAAIKEHGRLAGEIGKTDSSDTARMNSLGSQMAIVAAKQKEYQATESVKFSELELARIQEARVKALEKASAAAASSGRILTSKSDIDIKGYEGDIRKLEVALSKVTPDIDTEGFARAKNEIAAVKETLDKLKDTNGTDAQKEAMSRFEAQVKVAKQAINEVKATEFELRGLQRLIENIDQLDMRLNKMEINWSAFKADPDLEHNWGLLKQRVDEVRVALKETEAAGDSKQYYELNKVYQELNNSARTLASEIQGAGYATKSFSDKVQETSKRLAAYLVSFLSFHQVISLLRDVVKYIREIDEAMTALKRVTNETEVTYDRFLINAYERASKLGTSVNKIIMATADFARLGYSIAEAEKLGDAASIYFNVGNVGSDVLQMNEAVQSIVSTMKAFGIEASNSMSIVDKFNEVGNNFAISSKGIGDSLFRSASSLAAANNTLDESIGLIVAANNVVQNPEVVGTALKTMSMRLRNTAGELEELGADADGAVESITKLQTQLLNLSSGRVDIMANSKEFKSTYQILLELSQIWGDLTDTAQAEVTRLVAGVRQGNVLAALMTGMADATATVETSLNSTNSAIRENEKWLQSLAGRISLLSTAFESTSNKLVSGNLVKLFVDMAAAAVNLAGAFNGLLGKLVVVPGSLFLVNAAFNALEATKFGEKMGQTFNWLKSLPSQMREYGTILSNISTYGTAGSAGLTKLSIATQGLTQSQIAQVAVRSRGLLIDQLELKAHNDKYRAILMEQLSTMGLRGAKAEETATTILNTVAKKSNITGTAGQIAVNTGLAASLKGVVSGLLATATAWAMTPMGMVTLAIGSVFLIKSAIDNYNRSLEENITKTKELGQAHRDAQISAAGNVATLEGLKEEYTKLNQGVDHQGRNVALSASEYARYQGIIQQIIDMNPSLVQGYNAEGEAILFRNRLLEDAIKLQHDYRDSAVAEFLRSGEDIIAGIKAANTQLGNELGYTLMSMVPGVSSLGEQIAGMFGKSFMGFSREFLAQNGITSLFMDSKLDDFGIVRTKVEQGDLEQLRLVAENMEALIKAFGMSSGEAEKFRGFIRDVGIETARVSPMVEEYTRYLTTWAFASKQQGGAVADGIKEFGQLNEEYLDAFAAGVQRIADSPTPDLHMQKNEMAGLAQTFIQLQDLIPEGRIADLNEAMANGTLGAGAYAKAFSEIYGIVEKLLGNEPEALTMMVNLGFDIDSGYIIELQDRLTDMVGAANRERVLSLNIGELTFAANLGVHNMTLDYLEAQLLLNSMRFQDAAASANEFADTISSLNTKMNTLNQIEDEMATNGGISPGTVATMMDELGDDYIKYLDEVGGKIRFNTEAYRDFITAQYQSNIKSLEATREQLAEWIALQETLNPNISWLEGANLTGVAPEVEWENWRAELDAAQEKLAGYDERLEIHNANMRNIIATVYDYEGTLKNLNDVLSVSRDAIEEMGESGYITWETFRSLEEVVPNISDYISSINGRLVLNTNAWDENAAATALAKKALDDYVAARGGYEGMTRGEIQVANYLWEQWTRLCDGYIELAEAKERVSQSTEDLADKYAILTGAVDEFKEYGNLQMDTVMGLLELGDDYLAMLEFTDGQIRLNTQALDEKLDSLVQQLIATEHARLGEELYQIAIQDVSGALADSQTEAEKARLKYVNLGNQALELAKNYGVATAAVQLFNTEFDGYGEGGLGLSPEALAATEKALEASQHRIDKFINNMAKGVEGNFTEGSAPSRGDKDKKGKDKYKEAAEREFKDLKYLYDKRLISEEVYLNRLRALNEKYYKGKADYLDDYYKYELEVINGLQRVNEQNLQAHLTQAANRQDFDKQVDIYKAFQEDLKKTGQQYRELGFRETDKEIVELQNKWQDYFNKIQETMSQKLELQLSIAQENFDFNGQMDIYRQFQQNIMDEANHYRAMGLRDEDAKIQELEKKYRAYATQIVNVYDDMFKRERESFDRHLSNLDFKISITPDNKAADHERLLNEKLENRLDLSQKLLNQMVRLRMETDENTRATEAYKNLMHDLESAYDANIKAIYDLVAAHKQLAESQIADVRDLQEKVIAMLRARYQKEQELLRENYSLKKKQIDAEKDLLKKRYDAEVKYIDEMLKALNKQWTEEDKRRKKQEDLDDINEIQRKINELRLAAATGDSEAISRIEDLQKQLADKLKKINDDEEKDRRDNIRDELNDQKEALRDKHEQDMAYLDRRQEMIDKEYEAEQKLLDKKLKNANLYAEAKTMLEKGVNEQLLQQLRDYEDEFGEGMGILGDYVKIKLTQQILDAGEALKNLIHNVRIATDQNLFEKILNGENIIIRDILAEMFDATSLADIIAKINEAISNIDIDAISRQMRLLGDDFNRFVNGNFDLNTRMMATVEQMRQAGWENVDNATATFNTNHRVTDAAGNQITIKVTPIMENGEVLTPNQLQRYVNGQINGAANLLEADGKKLIIATEVGWNDDAFIELDERLEAIKERHTDLWYSMQENVVKFASMSDEGLYSFIEQQFGKIPIVARDAIAEVLRALGIGKVGLEEALENIFNLPVDNVNAVLSSNLSSLSKEQIQVIKQMRQNSIAWEKATTEAEKARLEAENERLALAQGWFKDTMTGTWYLDEDKTQKLFETINEFQTAQLENIDELIDKYEEDYKRYDEFQRKKFLSVKKFNGDVMQANNDLLHVLSQNMQRFVDNFGDVLNQIGQAATHLISRLKSIGEINISLSTEAVGGNMTGFKTGGYNREAGIRFLHPHEQVLSAEQTKAFSELVFGLGASGMQNIANNTRNAGMPAPPVQNRSIIDASFNFNGSITQEAMPQVRKLVNDAIYELEGKIPTIVANDQRANLRRIGGR